MEKLKMALIGCGAFSKIHLDGFRNQKKAEIVALCDKDINRARERAEEFYPDAAVYDDADKLLADPDIDAVIIATIDQAHRELTVKALHAGKHVLCEKPMALTIEDCEAMVKAEEETGKKLMIGQVCRLTPGFMEAKRLVDEGVIGELFYVESTYAHDYSSFTDETSWRADPLRHIVIGGTCHAIDLLRWIAGNPTETTAYSTKKVLTQLPTDDTVVAIFRFPNNVIGKVFTSSGCKRPYTMRTQLYGTEGTIVVDNTDNFITIYKEHITSGGKVLDGAYGAEQENEVHIRYPIPVNNHNVCGEHDAFIAAILEDKPVPTNGREGMATVKVCKAVIESADERKTVTIEY